jgi:hypothetical protein
MSFLASSHARLTWDQAVAATKPFFDARPIQGFFNGIDPERALMISAMNGREPRGSGLRLDYSISDLDFGREQPVRRDLQQIAASPAHLRCQGL